MWGGRGLAASPVIARQCCRRPDFFPVLRPAAALHATRPDAAAEFVQAQIERVGRGEDLRLGLAAAGGILRVEERRLGPGTRGMQGEAQGKETGCPCRPDDAQGPPPSSAACPGRNRPRRRGRTVAAKFGAAKRTRRPVPSRQRCRADKGTTKKTRRARSVRRAGLVGSMVRAASRRSPALRGGVREEPQRRIFTLALRAA